YSKTMKAGVVEFRLVNETSSKGKKFDTRGRSKVIAVHDLRGFEGGFKQSDETARRVVAASYQAVPPKPGQTAQTPEQIAAIDNRALLRAFAVVEPPWTQYWGRWGFKSK